MAITLAPRRNIVNVSWSDHLTFGEGDGRLATPDAMARRLVVWRDRLGAAAIHWRMLRSRIPHRLQTARGRRHWMIKQSRGIDWDDSAVVPGLAHRAGLCAYLYVSLFDEGWPLARPTVRAVSHHNAMHGRDVAWQSEFSRDHPEYLVVDQAGRRRQQGVLSLAYPEVRAHFLQRIVGAIAQTDFDGVFVCLRSQSKPALFGDELGFNEPACRDFQARHGVEPRSQPFDLGAWRRHLGGYLTTLLRELRVALRAEDRRLAVGAPRGDVLGPPLGNAELQWRVWVEDDLLDELVVNQNSSQCPSMWHQLWPMHRGSGYIQNYRDGSGMPALRNQLATDYGPVCQRSRTRLYVARQWSRRSSAQERALLAQPAVDGLVFSSFRFDNPAAIAQGDWRA